MSRTLRKVESTFCATEVDGELVMIHVDTGKFFSMKGVSLDIWQKLDRIDDLDLICAELQHEYGISPEECSNSVSSFADQLVAAGFASES
ncbi:hypothetical protein GGQ88_001352 [Novosphingobium hassiacum]|uniref:PqqD family protein n=1 Tax=Novosphingobium hassiacum TaxID=173676 RepID=A0A7W5ZUB5_9SPHN|nr:PqqD family protein [Novosphingobium hassiacum]MBB3860091.1 hypothetical protein [Novosphingobium hassiacum]